MTVQSRLLLQLPIFLGCLACLACLAACSFHAAPRGLAVPSVEERLEQLRSSLDLTPDQEQAMLPILREEHEENAARVASLEDKSGYKLRHAERRIREEFQVRREITRDAFADILTPEQLAIYDTLKPGQPSRPHDTDEEDGAQLPKPLRR